MRRQASPLVTIALFLAIVASLPAQGGTIRYIYDELGRLVGVIDQNGDAAAYHYDAVGNLTSITRTGPSDLAVIEFTPNAGGVGGSITIHGTGFSATPSQNTVTINGVAATVVSASANTLVVTIPSGATSGPLSITTPNGTTVVSFSVISITPAPTITNFSPTIGPAGTAVAINGTAFETTASMNNVSFNTSYATAGTTTATQIATTVPSSGTSGRITVATPRGAAISTQDFFVPPAPYVAADVLVSDRMTLTQDKLVSLGTADKIALLLFDLTSGQRASLKASSVSIPFSTISIRDPHGRTAASVGTSSSSFLNPITATVPGTYTVMVDPAISYTGSATLRLYDVPADVTGAIAPGGSSVTVTTTVPGQNGRLTFSGTTGQRVSLRMSSVGMLSCGISIRDANNIVLQSASVSFGGGFIEPLTLPSSGQYSIVVDPTVEYTGSITLTLYDVPADGTGTITAGGSSVPVTITTAGQNARLTFSGTEGQRVSVTFSAGPQGQLSIRRPDDTVLASGSMTFRAVDDRAGHVAQHRHVQSFRRSHDVGNRDSHGHVA